MTEDYLLLQEEKEAFKIQSATNKSVTYTSFDSHYYLSDWEPLHQDARVLVVGGAFPAIPGHYILPMH